MHIGERVEKCEYLYIDKDGVTKTGSRYNLGVHSFSQYANEYLFGMLFNQFLMEYRLDLKKEIDKDGEQIFM